MKQNSTRRNFHLTDFVDTALELPCLVWDSASPSLRGAESRSFRLRIAEERNQEISYSYLCFVLMVLQSTSDLNSETRMGTPQFPDLGKHCSLPDCKQIDFLPFTCDCCSQVFCLEHRSYNQHQCPKAEIRDVTVVICPLCAKGVRLRQDENPHITWENHVNTDCDPSNYDKVTKKRKCPVHGCKEVLAFSNTIKCRDCTLDHCLKHRFGPDHNCPGPKKPETGFGFLNVLNRSRKEERKPNQSTATSSPKWASFLNAASSFRASAEASMAKLSSELSQKWQIAKDGTGQSSSSSGSGGMEGCPQCGARFSSVTTLIEHVEKVHERSSNQARAKLTVDVCPKCSKGFRDPVALVEHVERDHRGTSKA